jgi:predicted phosphodiesterase
MRFIIVNDVHGNSTALRKFLNTLQVLEFDKIIFLGDLLTYGVDVSETIALLHEIENAYSCIFIKGNHEQIYFDYQKGLDFQYKKFPEFLLESISDTADKLTSILEEEFEWQERFCYSNVLFTHANLFEYGDWSYLNSEADFLLNFNVLNSSTLRGAILGHTHRSKYKVSSDSSVFTEILKVPFNLDLEFGEGQKFLLTNGSLGQPRGAESSFLMCTISPADVTIRSLFLDYDVKLHCRSIINSGLSKKTKDKLLNYYS